MGCGDQNDSQQEEGTLLPFNRKVEEQWGVEEEQQGTLVLPLRGVLFTDKLPLGSFDVSGGDPLVE